jgi:hypothetical protein
MSMKDSYGALERARAAAIEDAHNLEFVGELVSIDVEDERIGTYLFEAHLPGYGGWRWAVTFAKVDDDSVATLCDVVLLPGVDSLIAPEWIPYKDRIQPGDIGVGDILPTSADDERLVPGFAALPGEEELEAVQLWEFGLGRARTLSIIGRDQASKRWYEGDRGPNNPLAMAAPLPCASCGFFIPMAGSLRSAFGVCSNAISPEDARVVSVDHGCGAHSEALVVFE